MKHSNEAVKPAPAHQVSLTFDLSNALNIDWFEGDFGGDETTLSNKIVKGNKVHECHNCQGEIVKGELHRSMTDKVDGEIDTYRWCQKCCVVAMLAQEGHDIR